MSPGGSASPSGNTTSVETPARMFGDTLHLHRSSANAKQVVWLKLNFIFYFLLFCFVHSKKIVIAL